MFVGSTMAVWSKLAKSLGQIKKLESEISPLKAKKKPTRVPGLAERKTCEYKGVNGNKNNNK